MERCNELDIDNPSGHNGFLPSATESKLGWKNVVLFIFSLTNTYNFCKAALSWNDGEHVDYLGMHMYGAWESSTISPYIKGLTN
jgi:hypothetical protein